MNKKNERRKTKNGKDKKIMLKWKGKRIRKWSWMYESCFWHFSDCWRAGGKEFSFFLTWLAYLHTSSLHPLSFPCFMLQKTNKIFIVQGLWFCHIEFSMLKGKFKSTAWFFFIFQFLRLFPLLFVMRNLFIFLSLTTIYHRV